MKTLQEPEGFSWNEIIKYLVMLAGIAYTMYYTMQQNKEALDNLSKEWKEFKNQYSKFVIEDIRKEAKLTTKISSLENKINKVEEKCQM